MLKKRYIEVFNKKFEFFRNNNNYKNRIKSESETLSLLSNNNIVNFNLKSKRVLKKVFIYKSKN